VEGEAERAKLGVDENTFAIYTILRRDHKSFEAKEAQQIKWFTNSSTCWHRTTARCSRVSCTPTCRIGKSASVRSS
jgi:hypothetical protein